MANTYEDLRSMLDREINAIVVNGDLDKDKLHCIYEMVDIVKDIGEIEEHESGYSQANRMYPGVMYDGGSSSYRGRYSNRNNANYNRGGSYNSYARGGYSRGNEAMERLERLMDEAQTEQERESIRRVMEMM